MAELVMESERGTDLPVARFMGGTWRHGSVFGISGPFGRLAFDDTQLTITGLDALLSVQRSETMAVRLGRFLVSTTVSVVALDGTEHELFFSGYGRTKIRHALEDRGWPVTE